METGGSYTKCKGRDVVVDDDVSPVQQEEDESEWFRKLPPWTEPVTSVKSEYLNRSKELVTPEHKYESRKVHETSEDERVKVKLESCLISCSPIRVEAAVASFVDECGALKKTPKTSPELDIKKNLNNAEFTSVTMEEESIRLARNGNPEFTYETLYKLGTRTEIPSFKCWKCPTSVDRMDRLESHYLSHGAQKKYRCKFCDFSVDQMHVVLRHEERHRPKKSIKSVSPSENSKATIPLLQSLKGSTEYELPAIYKTLKSKSQSVATFRNVKMESKDDRIRNDSEEELDMDAQSAEEAMEIGLDEGEPRPEAESLAEKLQSSIGSSLALKNVFQASGGDESGKVELDVENETSRPSFHQPNKSKTNRWACEICPATFKFQSVLKKHRFRHSQRRQFGCKYCNYSVDKYTAVKEHEKLHEMSSSELDQSQTSHLVSPVPSAHGSESSTSTAKSSHRYRYRSSATNQNLSDDENEMFVGNPAFTYETLSYNRKGREIVLSNTFKCYTCPSNFRSLRELTRHSLRHGATNAAYSCRVCDFNHKNKEHFFKHLERHKAQGNVPEDLLTLSKVPNNASQGISIGEADEVSILGNENDFEIEYGLQDEEFLNDSEVVRAPVQSQKTIAGSKNAKPSLPKLPSHELQVCLDRLDTIIPSQEAPGISDSLSGDEDLKINKPSSLSLEENESATPQNYLLKFMKISNFMCFEEICFNLDSDAITFSGGEGKSSSIIAFLLGLGYDILLDNYTPSVLCGWEISDLIKRGKEVAKIEISLSFKSYPTLLADFGYHLTICRTLRRGVPLSAGTFHIKSEDNGGASSSPKLISIPRLREILKDLFVLPFYSRLMLLDRQNMKGVLHDKDSWYEYFLDAVKSKEATRKTNLEKLMPMFKSLEGDLKWRNAEYAFLKKQLLVEYPIEEDPEFLRWRNEDVHRLRQVEQDLEDLTQKYQDLQNRTHSQTNGLASIPELVIKEMRTIYLEFLASQNCIGDILVNENTKVLRIWLREKNLCDSELPITTKEAEDFWTKTPQGKRQLGIFGLYLAFWKVNESCPFFAIDAYSSAELEFKFPSKALPILLRLVQSKSGQQYLMSFPESKEMELLSPKTNQV